MAEQCNSCRAEIVAGQRFCRSCGAPTGQFAEENIPTQMMPNDMGGRSQRGNTAPSTAGETGPVYAPPQSYYQPPVAQQPMPYYPPPRKRAPWILILVLAGLGLFIALGFTIFMITRSAGTREDRRSRTVQDVGPALDEIGAQETGRETILTKTFQLGAGARVSIENLRGSITVQGTDQPQAEVKIIKRGGSPESRRAVKIVSSSDGGNLSLKTAPTRGGELEVEYIVKVPRKLGQLEIKSRDSDVSLSAFSGQISVSTLNGDVEIKETTGNVTVKTTSGEVALTEVSGDVDLSSTSGDLYVAGLKGSAIARTASGDIDAALTATTPGKPLSFKTASGDVEVRLEPALDVNVSVRTISGDLEVDEELGLEVQEQPGRKTATGILGAGGDTLQVETASGSVKITR